MLYFTLLLPVTSFGSIRDSLRLKYYLPKKVIYTVGNLGFVVPCIFKYSNKTSNQMHQSIIHLLFSHTDAAQHVSDTIVPIIRSSFKLQLQPPVGVWMRNWSCFQPWSVWKHDHLRIHTATGGCDCSLKQLLIMGTIVPETCWATYMWLSNKCYDWLLHLVGCFIWTVGNIVVCEISH
jgi:hypothetical protein